MVDIKYQIRRETGREEEDWTAGRKMDALKIFECREQEQTGIGLY